MAPVKLYTTDNCARCVTAKTLLTKRGIGYEEVNLTKDPDGRAELARRTGMITFPQLVVGEETLGGLDALVAADRAGQLERLLPVRAPVWVSVPDPHH
jgi:glutaredoxin 3